MDYVRTNLQNWQYLRIVGLRLYVFSEPLDFILMLPLLLGFFIIIIIIIIFIFFFSGGGGGGERGKRQSIIIWEH